MNERNNRGLTPHQEVELAFAELEIAEQRGEIVVPWEEDSTDITEEFRQERFTRYAIDEDEARGYPHGLAPEDEH